MEKPRDEIEGKILGRIKECYKNNYYTLTTRRWFESDDVKYALKKIKNNMSRFKIVYIASHGGKSTDTDKSYALLGREAFGLNMGDSFGIDISDIKYLLNDRREDEYYFMFLLPCYSGGLVEDVVHRNVEDEDYAKCVPTSLGTKCVIAHSDCSNSPAFVGTERLMFNFNSNDSYSQQA